MPMPDLARREPRRSIQPDDILDLFRHPVRVGRGQVDLVQHRDDLDAEIDRGVAVGHGLRFHPCEASTTSSAPSQAESERLTS